MNNRLNRVLKDPKQSRIRMGHKEKRKSLTIESRKQKQGAGSRKHTAQSQKPLRLKDMTLSLQRMDHLHCRTQPDHCAANSEPRTGLSTTQALTFRKACAAYFRQAILPLNILTFHHWSFRKIIGDGKGVGDAEPSSLRARLPSWSAQRFRGVVGFITAEVGDDICCFGWNDNVFNDWSRNNADVKVGQDKTLKLN